MSVTLVLGNLILFGLRGRLDTHGTNSCRHIHINKNNHLKKYDYDLGILKAHPLGIKTNYPLSEWSICIT